MNNAFTIELPKFIGDKITFEVENSPNRHGTIIDFLTQSEDNTITVIGYKVKCKNNSIRSVLFDDIIIKTNWSDVPIGTKVKYKGKTFKENKYGYFAGVFDATKCIMVSKIDRDDVFTNTRMTDYSICEYIKYEDVELFED